MLNLLITIYHTEELTSTIVASKEVAHKMVCLSESHVMSLVRDAIHSCWDTEVMVFVFQFPVVAVDQWCPVTNPFTHMQHGHIRVLLAMGIEHQVRNIFPKLMLNALVFPRANVK